MNIWFAVNKNGYVGLYVDEPKRNTKLGKWESQFPYINSIANKKIIEFIQKANMSWENEPECINIKSE